MNAFRQQAQPTFESVRFRQFEAAFAVFFLLVFANAFRDAIEPIWEFMKLVPQTMLLGLVLLSLWQAAQTFLRAPILLILFAYALVSLLWTADLWATGTRFFGLFFTTLFAVWFATRYTIRQQLDLLALSFFLAIMMSVVVVVAFPDFARMDDGSWRGIFTHKNVLGRVMVVTAIIALVYPMTSRLVLFLKSIGYLAALFLILMANSITALLVLIVVTGLYAIYQVFRLALLPRRVFITLLIVGATGIALLAATVDIDTVTGVFGRSSTLTGRTDVWDKTITAIEERPLLGYGYGAFWFDWDGLFGELWSTEDDWIPGSAHNAVLDIWVELGVIALALLLGAFIANYALALHYSHNITASYALWPLLYLTFLLVVGIVESWALHNDIFWMLFLTVAFSLSNARTYPQDDAPPIEIGIPLWRAQRPT